MQGVSSEELACRTHLRNSSMSAMETWTSRIPCCSLGGGPPGWSTPSGGTTSMSWEQVSPGCGA